MRIELVWEDDREEHIARHGVKLEEVLEVVQSRHFQRRVARGKLRLIGLTRSGRYLTVFVGQRTAGEYGLITARDATKRERGEYGRHGMRRIR